MPGTIRENLLYGLEREVSDDELWQALDMAYAQKTLFKKWMIN